MATALLLRCNNERYKTKDTNQTAVCHGTAEHWRHERMVLDCSPAWKMMLLPTCGRNTTSKKEGPEKLITETASTRVHAAERSLGPFLDNKVWIATYMVGLFRTPRTGSRCWHNVALVPRTRPERARCTPPQALEPRTRPERARCTPPQAQVPRFRLERA